MLIPCSALPYLTRVLVVVHVCDGLHMSGCGWFASRLIAILPTGSSMDIGPNSRHDVQGSNPTKPNWPTNQLTDQHCVLLEIPLHYLESLTVTPTCRPALREEWSTFCQQGKKLSGRLCAKHRP